MFGIMTEEERQREYEYQQRANFLMECFADYPSESGGVKFGKCKGDHNCDGCPAYIEFYKVMKGYEEQEGISTSEALWLTTQFYGIANAYMCDGEIESWSKVYTPEKYRKALKRQRELMGENDQQEEREEQTEKTEKTGQLSIFDFI